VDPGRRERRPVQGEWGDGIARRRRSEYWALFATAATRNTKLLVLVVLVVLGGVGVKR
jgi:hypothetical protein